MEALVSPGTIKDELRLLVELPAERPRAGGWVVSLLVHAAGIAVFLLAPASTFQSFVAVPERRGVTALVAPPDILTQRAANQGKVAREVSLENLLPRRRIFIPPGAPALARTKGREAAPAPKPAPIPEPPQLQTSGLANARALPPGSGSQPHAPPPPPQIQPEEKPKLAFERPGAQNPIPRPGGLAPGRIAPPSTSITEATRAAMRPGGGGQTVGDVDLPRGGGLGRGLSQPGSPARSSSSLELLSDPQGVDFKPYLIRILAAVKRNWLVIIPETARLGRTGRVQVQFAISRDGSVPKLVIAMPSGTDALDRAAVAGVSMSTPFPPLPSDFRGSQVRLQFTFTYNMQNRID
jgi:TonB family protein